MAQDCGVIVWTETHALERRPGVPAGAPIVLIDGIGENDRADPLNSANPRNRYELDDSRHDLWRVQNSDSFPARLVCSVLSHFQIHSTIVDTRYDLWLHDCVDRDARSRTRSCRRADRAHPRNR